MHWNKMETGLYTVLFFSLGFKNKSQAKIAIFSMCWDGVDNLSPCRHKCVELELSLHFVLL